MAEFKRAYLSTSSSVDFEDGNGLYKSVVARACKQASGDAVAITVERTASHKGKITLPGGTTYTVEVVFSTESRDSLIAKFDQLKPSRQRHLDSDKITWSPSDAAIPERDPPPPPPKDTFSPSHGYDPANAVDL